MENQTNWTPSPHDNKLGIIDHDSINQFEAKGIATAELYLFGLDSNTEFSTQLVCEIHRIAFSELYDWAGQWRTNMVVVGQLIPPEPVQIIHLMYQFVEQLNFKISRAQSANDHIACLVYAHYEFVRIHPFNNGNGRTGRMIMNLVALKFGYRPLELYHREGDSRKIYIDAMKAVDRGNVELLTALIRKELITL